MAIKTSMSETQKVTVVFPKPLLERLRECVPPRQRSAFIVEAVEEKLALQEQFAAIEEAAGCWSDEDHPELRTDEDIDRWLAEIRESWDAHLAAIGAQHDEESAEGQVPAG
jgi:FPC/CPF motif-containing protein YcgG